MTSATLVPAAEHEIDRQRTAIVARALSDPKRLCVLETLATGERSVSELSRDVGCQVPNMSQHLARAALGRPGHRAARGNNRSITAWPIPA